MSFITDHLQGKGQHIIDTYFTGDFLECLPSKFIIAGGCFGKVMNDIDVFPCEKKLRIDTDDLPSGYSFITETKNAITLRGPKGKVIQLCNYSSEGLWNLVDSFDFAHIQAGARITDGECGEVIYSPEWLEYNAIGDSCYLGSEYPLSSMVRLMKYRKRDAISKHQMIGSIIGIIRDVRKRGFHDWDDFKDQLDAVDLGLLPEDLESLGHIDLREFYELFKNE